jgi:hypothetical protein
MTSTDLPLIQLLDRFCSEILPKIHHQIQWLSLESSSIERILLAANYPNLCQLDIFILTEEPQLHLNGTKSHFVYQMEQS